MLKVFLVEDEIIMREGIKKKIDWEKEGFCFVGDAGDGELAYPLILKEKPDILITDIKMPFMDGLELSRLVKAELPDIKIIVLSGYNDFDYAKEAIDIGIAEYMLKPVTSVKLLETLHKVGNSIYEQRKKADGNKNEQEQKMLARRNFFIKFVTADCSVSSLLKEGKELGVELAATDYNVLLLQLFNNGSIEEYTSKLIEVKKEFDALSQQNPNIVIIDRGREEFWIIFKGQTECSVDALYRDFEKWLIELISNRFCLEYFGVIGQSTARMGEMKNCYTAANAEFAHRFLKKKNQIVDISLLDKKTETEEKPIYLENLNVSKSDRKNIENFINTGLKSEIDAFLDSYFEKIGNKNIQSILFRQYVVMDIYIAAVNIAEEMGYSKQELSQLYGTEENLLKVFGSIEDTKEYLKHLLETTIDIRDKGAGNKYDQVLKQAQEYIEENYFMDDISLNTVASSVNLSPNHFSTIFSQKLGETFIEYLTRIRMEKAKELLRTTSKKLTDIAFEVGYKDSHYFGSIFKKTQGCTPREYRSKD